MKITGPKIHQRTVNYYRFLSEINNIELSDSVFSSIVYNKLNFHYKPLIELCKLIYESCRLTDNRGNNIFSGFIANMNLVFEKFILKSLQQIMPQETIHASLKNDWAIPTEKFLPEIKPDILVRNRAIIDVKYYKSPFTQKDKFITGHIFQIVFYLNAYKLRKGILVYPQPEDVDDIISKSYFIDENNFQIFCIPLNRNISDIENSIFELKSILMN
jgi:5-methylcytosine-specific restriction enzyme subunit McrC